MCLERQISGEQLSRTLVQQQTSIAVSLGARLLEAQGWSDRLPHAAAVEMGWMDTVLQNGGDCLQVALLLR